ncbi:MAG: PAS domain-containing protein [Alphaproteobacteria bacterium]|nr:PAS domain-containing protein [Alphaproteobacteria bacterium]
MNKSAVAVVALTVVPALVASAALAANAHGTAAVASLAAAFGGAAAAGIVLRRNRQASARAAENAVQHPLGASDRLTEGQLRLFDNIPDPLLHVGPERTVLAANRAARALFGASLEDRDLAHVMRQPDVLAATEAILAGEPGREVQIEFAGSAERHFAVRIEPLAQAGALLLLHDTTQLAKLERMRADFVANASHEIRTPLASLVGFIETLRGPARDDAEARAKFLEIMQDQARRMARLVDDLLSLSRIELREHTPPTGSVDIAMTLAALKTTLDRQAEARRMPIVLDVATTLPKVVGDGDELTQVFQNLIDNALKYGKPGTEVRVAAGEAAQLPPSFPDPRRRAVAVSVTDTGEGVAREHLSRLTERFYRVDIGRSRDLGGTGLGLAIVKHIVSHHRGAIVIDSEVGRGSTFTVYLPVAT